MANFNVDVNATIADGSIANAKLADMNESTIKGRAAGAGSGDPQDLTASQARTAMGLGTAATQDSSAFDSAGSAAAAQAAAIAASQPLDADLTAIAGLSPANDDIIQRKSGAWTNRTLAQLAADLATVSGVAIRTGATIAFDAPAIYNTPTSPSSGTVTLDLSGAVAGTEVVACFNHASEPSWPSGVSAVGTWNNSALNIVRFTYIDSSNIVAVIVSDAATSSTTNGGWPRVVKTVTESRTSTTTLTADTDLRVTMGANKKYLMRATVYFGVAGTGPGLKYGFTGPASPTLVRATGTHTSATATPPANFAQNAYETTGKVFPSSAAGLHVAQLEFYIENGANAGDFVITWAQNASSGTASNSGRGSFIEYVELP